MVKINKNVFTVSGYSLQYQIMIGTVRQGSSQLIDWLNPIFNYDLSYNLYTCFNQI